MKLPVRKNIFAMNKISILLINIIPPNWILHKANRDKLKRPKQQQIDASARPYWCGHFVTSFRFSVSAFKVVSSVSVEEFNRSRGLKNIK